MSGIIAAMAGMSVAGGIMGAIGSSQASAGQAAGLQAQAAAGRYNAAVLEVRALEAERNRGIAYAKAGLAASDTKRKNRAVIGQVRAAYGANGLSMDGSPLDVLQETAVEQEMDVAKVLYAGDLEALAETDRAASFRQQAVLARMGVQSNMDAAARVQGNAWIGVTTALLSGASGALSAYRPRPTMTV